MAVGLVAALLVLVLAQSPQSAPPQSPVPPAAPSTGVPQDDGRPAGTASPADLVRAADAAKAQRASKQRIAALTQEAEVLRRQAQSVLGELRRLDVERDLQRARAAEAQNALVLLDADLKALTARQAQLQGVLADERRAIAARLRRLQRLGRVGYARIAWHADRARDVGRAARLMTHLARDDGQRLAAYRQTAAALAATDARVTARRGEARTLEVEAGARRMAAELAYGRKRDLLGSMTRETEQRDRWLAELTAARSRLDADMTARAAAPTAAAPTAVPTRQVPFETRRQQLRWPLAGTVAQRFGRQRDPRFGTATVRNGIDIASPAGSEATAIHPGTVAFAGPFTGFGQLVIVDHGRQVFSLYGYLSTLRVSRGTRVEAGSPVGDVGESPVGGSALYFELRVDGRPVDPLQWLKRP